MSSGLLQGLVNDQGAFQAGPQPPVAPPPPLGPPPQGGPPPPAGAVPPPAQPAQPGVTGGQPAPQDDLVTLAAELGVSPATLAGMGPQMQQLVRQQVQRRKQFDQELQQQQQLLKAAMDPDAVRQYLPNGGKMKASDLLQDAIYNISQLNLRNPAYGSLRGQDYVPIQQQRFEQALKLHQAHIQDITQANTSLRNQANDANTLLGRLSQSAQMEQVAKTAQANQQNQLKMEQERTYAQQQMKQMAIMMTVTGWANDWKPISEMTGDQAQAAIQRGEATSDFQVVPGSSMYKLVYNKAGGKKIVPDVPGWSVPTVTQDVKEISSPHVVGDKVVSVTNTNTDTKTVSKTPGGPVTTKPPSLAPPVPSAAPTPTTSNPGPLPNAAQSRSVAGPILGDSPAAAKRKAEAQDLTAAGKLQVADVDKLMPRLADILDKLSSVKDSNVPLRTAWPMLKYKLGMADSADPSSLNSLMSELSLTGIQAIMPYATKSRNFKYIQMIGKHVWDVNKDSGNLMWDKASNITRNMLTFKATAMRDELLHATGTNPLPVLSDVDRSRYDVIAGGTWDPAHKTVVVTKTQAAKSDAMARSDGWDLR